MHHQAGPTRVESTAPSLLSAPCKELEDLNKITQGAFINNETLLLKIAKCLLLVQQKSPPPPEKKNTPTNKCSSLAVLLPKEKHSILTHLFPLMLLGFFNESLEAVQVAHKPEPLSDSSVPSCSDFGKWDD